MRTVLLLVLFAIAAPLSQAQIALPVTFEGNINYELTDFGGASSLLVADPADAANTVVRTLRPSGAECWAGTTVAEDSGFTARVPFAPGATTMSVRVWSPLAGVPVRLKVEQVGVPTVSVETEATTTVGQQWETLVFNFAQQAPSTAAINFGST